MTHTFSKLPGRPYKRANHGAFAHDSFQWSLRLLSMVIGGSFQWSIEAVFSTVIYTGSFQWSFTLAPFNIRFHWLLSMFVYTGSFQWSVIQAPFNGHLKLFFNGRLRTPFPRVPDTLSLMLRCWFLALLPLCCFHLTNCHHEQGTKAVRGRAEPRRSIRPKPSCTTVTSVTIKTSRLSRDCNNTFYFLHLKCTCCTFDYTLV